VLRRGPFAWRFLARGKSERAVKNANRGEDTLPVVELPPVFTKRARLFAS
jgi:hypothetical protein